MLQHVERKISEVDAAEAEVLSMVGAVSQGTQQYLQLLQGVLDQLTLLVEEAMLNNQHRADEVRGRGGT